MTPTIPGAPAAWQSVEILSDGVHRVDVRQVRTCLGVVGWLVVRREDGTAIQGWDELQGVKNDVAGPERLAVEFFPRQSELINVANARHLWVLPDDWSLPLALPSVAETQECNPWGGRGDTRG